MSKEHHISQVGKKVKQPEVGDVWESFIAKYLVVDGYEEYVYCVVKEGDCVGVRTIPSSYLRDKCTYLGKSKVSIKELFDVKD